jgi:hypothetical protein
MPPVREEWRSLMEVVLRACEDLLRTWAIASIFVNFYLSRSDSFRMSVVGISGWGLDQWWKWVWGMKVLSWSWRCEATGGKEI